MFQLKRELHIRRTVCVVEYCEAESPMVIGFIKPVLVLPKEQYSSEDLFFILKHELVHLKRGDVYLKLLFVTANAVHWFNPLIWIMKKEAVIDMELSCDERVTQGTDFELRKAYTETLLSMLHKRCVRKTVLSTQFYGGKKIMKKRFKNILIRNRKKNGISILIGAVVLTISLGMLVGCSVTKEDTGNVSGQSEDKADRTEPMPVGNVDAIQKFLASTYEGKIDIYKGTGTISDLTVKGLSDTDEKKMENGKYNVSIEFRDSNYEDMFQYLTSILVKEEDGWKIQFYGVEG